MSPAIRVIVVCYASISAGIITGGVAYIVMQAFRLARRPLGRREESAAR